MIGMGKEIEVSLLKMNSIHKGLNMRKKIVDLGRSQCTHDEKLHLDIAFFKDM